MSVECVLPDRTKVKVAADGRIWVGKEFVPLSPMERRFLEALAKKGGELSTVQDLLLAIYGSSEYAISPQIFRVYASKIRKKLEKVHPKAGAVLLTVTGEGFAFKRHFGA